MPLAGSSEVKVTRWPKFMSCQFGPWTMPARYEHCTPYGSKDTDKRHTEVTHPKILITETQTEAFSFSLLKHLHTYLAIVMYVGFGK